jgi:integrase/recombinase XerC/integrase/recombinase XerD
MLALGQEAQKALLLYIRMRKDQCPELWISDDGRPMTRAGICVTIKKLCDRAGIQGVKKGPHTFRHTFATQSYMNGAREFEVQRLLGHSTQTMTKRYVNLADGLLLNQRRFSPADNFFRKHK